MQAPHRNWDKSMLDLIGPPSRKPAFDKPFSIDLSSIIIRTILFFDHALSMESSLQLGTLREMLRKVFRRLVPSYPRWRSRVSVLCFLVIIWGKHHKRTKLSIATVLVTRVSCFGRQ
jgi:hypothetical protein